MVLDVERLPATITLPPGTVGLWALVREGGRPRGMLKLEDVASSITTDELQNAIATLPPSSALPPLRLPDRPPRISVVVCTMYSRRSDLSRCLQSMARLDYPDFEVLVIDNRADANPPIPPVPGVRILREPAPGLSRARNAGIAAADGEIIAFTDDDVSVDPLWLTAIAAFLQDHPDAGGVTGMVMPIELVSDAQLAIEMYYGSFGPRTMVPVSHRLRTPRGATPLAPATVDAVDDRGVVQKTFPLYAAGLMGAGANFAARASILEEIGGFDPTLGPGTETESAEDLELFARFLWNGHPLGLEPAAIVHHRHRSDLAGLRKQIEGYGVGQIALVLTMIRRDQRHLGRLLGSLPKGAYTAARLYVGRVTGSDPAATRDRDAPSAAESVGREARLGRAEARGMMRGPGAFVRARRRT